MRVEPTREAMLDTIHCPRILGSRVARWVVLGSSAGVEAARLATFGQFGVCGEIPNDSLPCCHGTAAVVVQESDVSRGADAL